MAELQAQSGYAEQFFIKFADIFGPYLADAGISSAVLTDPATVLTNAQYVDVMEIAARERGEDNLGLHLGEQMGVKDLGVLGHAMVHAQTLEQFIETFSRYFDVFARGVELRLSISDNLANMSYRLTDSHILVRRQDSEMALACYHNSIREAVGDDWKLIEVHFEHKKPKDVSEHRRFFNAPVFFDKPLNALVFESSFLSRQLKEADSRVFPVLKGHLEEELAERGDESDLVDQVRNIIAKSLSTQVPSLAEVAEALGLPSWTLQRRLRDKNLVYTQLVTDTRRQLAESYLKNTQMPLTEVAFLLGYSDLSAFSRAFRRWQGVPPVEFRRAATPASFGQ